MNELPKLLVGANAMLIGLAVLTRAHGNLFLFTVQVFVYGALVLGVVALLIALVAITGYVTSDEE